MAEKFEYNYTSPTQEERKEIDSILKDYMPKTDKEAKLELLRKLDFRVKNVPVIIGISHGVIGTLIFGTGLTCFLEWNLYIVGTILAAVGLVIAAVAYPLFNFTHRKLKEKYAETIVKISNELLNN